MTGRRTRPLSLSARAVMHRAAGDDLDARIHVGHVPAAVSAWVLHARAEHAAAAAVRGGCDPAHQVRVERLRDPGDPDTAAGHELFLACFLKGGVHLGLSRVGPGKPAETQKAAACPGRSLSVSSDTRTSAAKPTTPPEKLGYSPHGHQPTGSPHWPPAPERRLPHVPDRTLTFTAHDPAVRMTASVTPDRGRPTLPNRRCS